jgi:hypothetical protein
MLLSLLYCSYNKRIDKLDLGENFLSGLPARMFNGSLMVNDLNLDYNYIDKLQVQVPALQVQVPALQVQVPALEVQFQPSGYRFQPSRYRF